MDLTRRETRIPSDLFRHPLRLSLLGVIALPLIQLRIGQFTVSDIFFALALVFWFRISASSNFLKPIFTSWLLSSSALLAITTIVTSFNAQDTFSNFLGATKFVFAISVVGFVTFLNIRFGQDIQRTLYCFALGGAIASLSAALGIGNSYVAGDFTRLAGLAGHPVGLAITAGSCFAILIFLPRGGFPALLRVVLIGLNAMGVVWAIGVTGLVIGIAGIVAGLLFTSRAGQSIKRIVTLLFILSSGLAVWAISGIGGELTQRVTDALVSQDGFSVGVGATSGSTLGLRVLTWEVGLQRIADQPILGNGFDEQGQLAVGNLATHNYLILAWQSGGIIVGLIAITLILWAIVRMATLWKNRHFSSLAPVVAAQNVAFLASAMTGPALFGRGLYFQIALGIGFTYLLNKEASKN